MDGLKAGILSGAGTLPGEPEARADLDVPRSVTRTLARCSWSLLAGIIGADRGWVGTVEWLVVILVLVVLVVLLAVLAQRRRRAGGVIATRRKR
jgi:hypothetical protein